MSDDKSTTKPTNNLTQPDSAADSAPPPLSGEDEQKTIERRLEEIEAEIAPPPLSGEDEQKTIERRPRRTIVASGPGEDEQKTIERRLEEIEAEIAAADQAAKDAAATIASLRAERDRLNARLAPKRQMSQAEAHAQLVRSGQEQRAARAGMVRSFLNQTGGFAPPSILTPAEQAAKNRPRI